MLGMSHAGEEGLSAYVKLSPAGSHRQEYPIRPHCCPSRSPANAGVGREDKQKKPAGTERPPSLGLRAATGPKGTETQDTDSHVQPCRCGGLSGKSTGQV